MNQPGDIVQALQSMVDLLICLLWQPKEAQCMPLIKVSGGKPSILSKQGFPP